MRTISTTIMISLALFWTCMTTTAWTAEGAITFASLLDEMVDRETAARFPSPAYACRQQSSYDPASVTPQNQGTWMANNDWSHFRRSEQHHGREQWVMLDAKGPGCVVRIWTTAFDPRGTVRIYIDNAKEPVIELPIQQLIGGEGLVGAPLSEVRARGMNLYLPIPYARRCLITYDRPHYWRTQKQEDQLYYQVNYRTYEAGTEVESFSRETFDAAEDQIAKLQKTLLAPAGTLADNLRDLELPSKTLHADDRMVMKLKGALAVRKLSVRLEADDLQAASRETVISIAFDDQPTVWCPVGDFFGSGVGVNPYRGWWREVDQDGRMTCYWVMPFQESFTMELKNLGKQAVKISAKASVGSFDWDDRSMYFHTNWRQEYPIDTSVKHDWNYLEATGQGVYMGDTLALNNPSEIWWGEGDEKIYFDGQQFPSHFGTGTEDYYGYAWCTPEFFQSPFHSQPLAEGPANKGHVTNTRVRMLDAIPFARDFRFDMEVWHWRPVNVAYAATTYWYGRPGSKGNHGPAPKMARVIVGELLPPPKVKGAIEGEGLKILDKTGDGQTQVQEVGQFNWSENKQLWWIDGKPGDKLVLSFPVEKAGNYELKAALTKAIDYGIVQLSLDGKPLGNPIDLINDGVTTQVVSLGTHELAAGKHTLTVEITGANPRAIKHHMFGLDYLKLDTVE